MDLKMWREVGCKVTLVCLIRDHVDFSQSLPLPTEFKVQKTDTLHSMGWN